MYGFSNMRKSGNYHWIICDQLLFEGKDQLFDDDADEVFWPFFRNVTGDVRYDTVGFYAPYDPDPTKNVYCNNCNSYLGENGNTDALPWGPYWEISSSALWFKINPKELKSDEKPEDFMFYNTDIMFEDDPEPDDRTFISKFP